MNAYDFVFSNQPRHRISRHTTFWLAYWIFFLISSYIPTCVFPGWDTGKFSANVARIGLFKWLELRLINSTITFIPLLAFAYTLIYFVLPRFFFNKKNRVTTTILFVLIFIPILLAQFFTWYQAGLNNYHAVPGRMMPGYDVVLNTTCKFILSNYPVVAGLAVIIKLLKHWYLKHQETAQVAKEKTKAELQLLKARIHPHFLFNSLNNIYSFALEASPKTPAMIQKLSGLLHYMLHDCNNPQVALEKELKMIEDYIALEKIRYGDRLKLNVQILPQPGTTSQHEGSESRPVSGSWGRIAPLLLIPFVENSFKHGTSKMLVNPEVNLDIHVDEEILYFQLINNRPVDMEEISVNGNRGLGLKNVKKRLALLYPNRHELKITEEAATYSVYMKIVLKDPSLSKKKGTTKKEKPVYELA